jgi:hypothetical protein
LVVVRPEVAVSSRHLTDSRKKPLTEERKRAREAAVRELETDFFERGGLEPVIPDDLSIEDKPCALHAVPPPHLRSTSPPAADWGWPKDELDRRLVEAASDSGCHVFLTSDKGALKTHKALFPRGIAILSPGQLLEALDDSGELDGTGGGDLLSPDLSTFARFHAGFAD